MTIDGAEKANTAPFSPKKRNETLQYEKALKHSVDNSNLYSIKRLKQGSRNLCTQQIYLDQSQFLKTNSLFTRNEAEKANSFPIE